MSKRSYTEILEQMTLHEKASLCSGLTSWLTKPVERLGVPSVRMGDGPHGIRKERPDASPVNVMNASEPATCFPTAVTLASSWDEALLYEVGASIAREAKALGITTVLGPGVNIKRSPLCGRNFEYFSEDPYLSGRMGAAWVRGAQEMGVAVSLKHFCCNNQEHLRLSIDAVLDERALREIYLPAFEMVVKGERPATVMCSYNRLNGTYLSEDKRMLTNVLRGEWGFDGIVISDWGAVNDRVAGVRAGMDLEMPANNGLNDREIVKAVQLGELSMAELDRVAVRLLKYAFDRQACKDVGGPIDFTAGHALSRRAAAQSAVLLKNDDALLPLHEGTSIAVIGALARTPRYQGSGSSHINPPWTVSFTQALHAAGQPFTYAEGYTLKGDGHRKGLIPEAVEAAKGKDAVVVFVGLTDLYESEGFDRDHMRLPAAHETLIAELHKVNPNLCVVLSGGSPIEAHRWESSAKSILNLYLGGQATGEAAYDLIFGRVNPSGKLAETYPLRNGDNIASRYFPMGPRTVEHRESVYVGYRYFDSAKKAVQYPFGFGLSYTTFEYGPLTLSRDRIDEGETLSVRCAIKNTGRVAGAEVVQLYIHDPESLVFRPMKELKGFHKIFLEPGEEKVVTFPLDNRAFSYYNTKIADWHIESGEFTIMVGASSRDIRQTATVYVHSKNPDAPTPYARHAVPWYYDPTGEDIPAEQFARIYDAPLPINTPYQKGELTANCALHQLRVSAAGRFLYAALTIGGRIVTLGSENRVMMLRSLQDMPLRGISGLLGGRLSHQSTEGLVDLCNGKKGGLRKVAAGFFKDKPATAAARPSRRR